MGKQRHVGRRAAGPNSQQPLGTPLWESLPGDLVARIIRLYGLVDESQITRRHLPGYQPRRRAPCRAPKPGPAPQLQLTLELAMQTPLPPPSPEEEDFFFFQPEEEEVSIPDSWECLLDESPIPVEAITSITESLDVAVTTNPLHTPTPVGACATGSSGGTDVPVTIPPEHIAPGKGALSQQEYCRKLIRQISLAGDFYESPDTTIFLQNGATPLDELTCEISREMGMHHWDCLACSWVAAPIPEAVPRRTPIASPYAPAGPDDVAVVVQAFLPIPETPNRYAVLDGMAMWGVGPDLTSWLATAPRCKGPPKRRFKPRKRTFFRVPPCPMPDLRTSDEAKPREFLHTSWPRVHQRRWLTGTGAKLRRRICALAKLLLSTGENTKLRQLLLAAPAHGVFLSMHQDGYLGPNPWGLTQDAYFPCSPKPFIMDDPEEEYWCGDNYLGRGVTHRCGRFVVFEARDMPAPFERASRLNDALDALKANSRALERVASRPPPVRPLIGESRGNYVRTARGWQQRNRGRSRSRRRSRSRGRSSSRPQSHGVFRTLAVTSARARQEGRSGLANMLDTLVNYVLLPGHRQWLPEPRHQTRNLGYLIDSPLGWCRDVVGLTPVIGVPCEMIAGAICCAVRLAENALNALTRPMGFTLFLLALLMLVGPSSGARACKDKGKFFMSSACSPEDIHWMTSSVAFHKVGCVPCVGGKCWKQLSVGISVREERGSEARARSAMLDVSMALFLACKVSSMGEVCFPMLVAFDMVKKYGNFFHHATSCKCDCNTYLEAAPSISSHIAFDWEVMADALDLIAIYEILKDLAVGLWDTFLFQHPMATVAAIYMALELDIVGLVCLALVVGDADSALMPDQGGAAGSPFLAMLLARLLPRRLLALWMLVGGLIGLAQAQQVSYQYLEDIGLATPLTLVVFCALLSMFLIWRLTRSWRAALVGALALAPTCHAGFGRPVPHDRENISDLAHALQAFTTQGNAVARRVPTFIKWVNTSDAIIVKTGGCEEGICNSCATLGWVETSANVNKTAFLCVSHYITMWAYPATPNRTYSTVGVPSGACGWFNMTSRKLLRSCIVDRRKDYCRTRNGYTAYPFAPIADCRIPPWLWENATLCRDSPYQTTIGLRAIPICLGECTTPKCMIPSEGQWLPQRGLPVKEGWAYATGALGTDLLTFSTDNKTQFFFAGVYLPKGSWVHHNYILAAFGYCMGGRWTVVFYLMVVILAQEVWGATPAAVGSCVMAGAFASTRTWEGVLAALCLVCVLRHQWGWVPTLLAKLLGGLPLLAMIMTTIAWVGPRKSAMGFQVCFDIDIEKVTMFDWTPTTCLCFSVIFLRVWMETQHGRYEAARVYYYSTVWHEAIRHAATWVGGKLASDAGMLFIFSSTFIMPEITIIIFGVYGSLLVLVDCLYWAVLVTIRHHPPTVPKWLKPILRLAALVPQFQDTVARATLTLALRRGHGVTPSDEVRLRPRAERRGLQWWARTMASRENSRQNIPVGTTWEKCSYQPTKGFDIEQQSSHGFLRTLVSSFTGRQEMELCGSVVELRTPMSSHLATIVGGALYATYHGSKGRPLASPSGPIIAQQVVPTRDLAVYPRPYNSSTLGLCCCTRPRKLFLMVKDGTIHPLNPLSDIKATLVEPLPLSTLKGSSGAPVLCPYGDVYGIFTHCCHARGVASLIRFTPLQGLANPETGVPSSVKPLTVDNLPQVTTDGQICMLHAPTGSGKSTQVPDYYVRKGLRVLVLVPNVAAVRALVPYVRSKYGTDPSMYCAGEKHLRPSKLTYSTYGMYCAGLHKNTSCFDVIILDEAHASDGTTILGIGLALRTFVPGCGRLYICATATPPGYQLTKHPDIEEEQLPDDGDIPFYGKKLDSSIYLTGRHVIFVPSKDGCMEIAAQLRQKGVKAVHYFRGETPDLPPTGDLVVVATDALCAGYNGDFDSVTDSGVEVSARVDVDYNPSFTLLLEVLPEGADTKAQRRGRTGRGRPGKYYYATANCLPVSVHQEATIIQTYDTGVVWHKMTVSAIAECLEAYNGATGLRPLPQRIGMWATVMSKFEHLGNITETQRLRDAGCPYPLLGAAQVRECKHKSAPYPDRSPWWKAAGPEPGPASNRCPLLFNLMKDHRTSRPWEECEPTRTIRGILASDDPCSVLLGAIAAGTLFAVLMQAAEKMACMVVSKSWRVVVTAKGFVTEPAQGSVEIFDKLHPCSSGLELQEKCILWASQCKDYVSGLWYHPPTAAVSYADQAAQWLRVQGISIGPALALGAGIMVGQANPVLACIASMVAGNYTATEGAVTTSIALGAAIMSSLSGTPGTSMMVGGGYLAGAALRCFGLGEFLWSFGATYGGAAAAASFTFDAMTGRGWEISMGNIINCLLSPTGAVIGSIFGFLLARAVTGDKGTWTNRLLAMLHRSSVLPDNFFLDSKADTDVFSAALKNMRLWDIMERLTDKIGSQDSPCDGPVYFLWEAGVAIARWMVNKVSSLRDWIRPKFPLFGCSDPAPLKGDGSITTTCLCGCEVTAVVREGRCITKASSGVCWYNWSYGMPYNSTTTTTGNVEPVDPDPNSRCGYPYAISDWVEAIKVGHDLFQVVGTTTLLLTNPELQRALKRPPCYEGSSIRSKTLKRVPRTTTTGLVPISDDDHRLPFVFDISIDNRGPFPDLAAALAARTRKAAGRATRAELQDQVDDFEAHSQLRLMDYFERTGNWLYETPIDKIKEAITAPSDGHSPPDVGGTGIGFKPPKIYKSGPDGRPPRYYMDRPSEEHIRAKEKEMNDKKTAKWVAEAKERSHFDKFMKTIFECRVPDEENEEFVDAPSYPTPDADDYSSMPSLEPSNYDSDTEVDTSGTSDLQMENITEPLHYRSAAYNSTITLADVHPDGTGSCLTKVTVVPKAIPVVPKPTTVKPKDASPLPTATKKDLESKELKTPPVDKATKQGPAPAVAAPAAATTKPKAAPQAAPKAAETPAPVAKKEPPKVAPAQPVTASKPTPQAKTETITTLGAEAPPAGVHSQATKSPATEGAGGSAVPPPAQSKPKVKTISDQEAKELDDLAASLCSELWVWEDEDPAPAAAKKEAVAALTTQASEKPSELPKGHLPPTPQEVSLEEVMVVGLKPKETKSDTKAGSETPTQKPGAPKQPEPVKTKPPPQTSGGGGPDAEEPKPPLPVPMEGFFVFGKPYPWLMNFLREAGMKVGSKNPKFVFYCENLVPKVDLFPSAIHWFVTSRPNWDKWEAFKDSKYKVGTCTADTKNLLGKAIKGAEYDEREFDLIHHPSRSPISKLTTKIVGHPRIDARGCPDFDVSGIGLKRSEGYCIGAVLTNTPDYRAFKKLESKAWTKTFWIILNSNRDDLILASNLADPCVSVHNLSPTSIRSLKVYMATDKMPNADQRNIALQNIPMQECADGKEEDAEDKTYAPCGDSWNECSMSYDWFGTPITTKRVGCLLKPVNRTTYGLGANKCTLFHTTPDTLPARAAKVTFDRTAIPGGHNYDKYVALAKARASKVCAKRMSFENAVKLLNSNTAASHVSGLTAADAKQCSSYAKEQVRAAAAGVRNGDARYTTCTLAPKVELFVRRPDKGYSTKASRFIVYPPLETRIVEKMFLGGISNETAKAVLKEEYGFQYTPREDTDRKVAAWRRLKNPMMLTTDAIAFDSQVTPEDIEIESQIFQSATRDELLKADIRALHDNLYKGSLMQNTDGERIGMRNCRASGVYTTSSGNCITNWIKTHAALADTGIKDFTLTICGDDLQIITESSGDPAKDRNLAGMLQNRLNTLGLRGEGVNIAYSLDELEVCSNHITTCEQNGREVYIQSRKSLIPLGRASAETTKSNPMDRWVGNMIAYWPTVWASRVLSVAFMDIVTRCEQKEVTFEYWGNHYKVPISKLPGVIASLHGKYCFTSRNYTPQAVSECNNTLTVLGCKTLSAYRRQAKHILHRCYKMGGTYKDLGRYLLGWSNNMPLEEVPAVKAWALSDLWSGAKVDLTLKRARQIWTEEGAWRDIIIGAIIGVLAVVFFYR
uniref:Genome polyprotein n=1 Tax=Guangxi chinese leopard gecko hepacivirus TaxID=2116374 RepID=A0A2P1GMN9_9FLAV|nr:polyprotein [Guangxi chinese leopard gecko hepacivirus]